MTLKKGDVLKAKQDGLEDIVVAVTDGAYLVRRLGWQDRGTMGSWLTDTQIETTYDLPKEPWKPEAGEKYWHLNNFVDWHYWDGDETDNFNLNGNNCFQTKQEAEHAAEKVKELLKSLQN